MEIKRRTIPMSQRRDMGHPHPITKQTTGLEAEGADDAADGVGAGAQAGLLLGAHGHGQQTLHALLAHERGHGDADVADAAVVGEQGTDGLRAPLVPEESFEDDGAGEADGVVGGALALDDALGGVGQPNRIACSSASVSVPWPGISQLRTGALPMLAPEVSGILLSPCSPTI